MGETRKVGKEGTENGPAILSIANSFEIFCLVSSGISATLFKFFEVIGDLGPTSPRLRADLSSLTGRLVSVRVVRGPSCLVPMYIYLIEPHPSHRSRKFYQ